MKKLVAVIFAWSVSFFPAQAENILEKAQAPAIMRAEYQSASGASKVLVDAVVIVPDVERIPIYEIRQRIFTPEEIGEAADVLMGEGQWRNVDSYTADLIFTENPAPAYKLEPATGISDTYNCFLCSPSENRRWLNAYYDRAHTAEGYGNVNLNYGYNVGRNTSRRVGTAAEARAQAEAVVKALWPELTFYGMDPELSGLAQRHAYGGGPSDYGYRLYYTRVLSGIPITSVEQTDKGEDRERDRCALPGEELFVDVGAEGIFQVNYSFPIEVAGMLAPDAELLPFSQIMDVFGAAGLESIALWEPAINNALRINRIQLGYLGVERQEDPARYQLVPVWDFVGERTIEAMVFGNARHSQITINAIDGTVIERTLCLPR